MESRYIDGATVPEFDAEITALLAKEFPEVPEEDLPPFAGIPEYFAGIENHQGEVYRILELEDLHDVVTLTQGLHPLGLRDQLDGRSSTSAGLDCRFAPTAET
ncbi:hypothetical protein [Larsenimonas suaedae]|uniref:Uncharacterized protein n=1 Tax=Larsenimonas suaedae TaxID=1851019 RepID=A0ABU1GZA3_9GAMM|nr:hypothetical protein [Larsenimonas suaedae]MCM2973476.1 hypothetical protein [Larsenimonas suaedae]MDR5897348.1 hypothetical protein [Larsenimonas suaedae]